MRKKVKSNWPAALCLLLVVGAGLLFLWPFPSPRTAEDPARTDAAAAAPTVETAAPAAPAPAGGEPSAFDSVSLPAPPEAQTPADEDAAKVRVSELMVKNRATLPDEDGDFPDWIELENVSGDTVELTGWRLRDSARGEGWTFPETRLAPGERLLLFASGKDRPGHVSFSLSGGETLQLVTDQGALAQDLICPDGDADVAWLPDGEGGWTGSLYPTPGLPNTAESYVALMERRVTDSPLVINEACTFNRKGRWKAQVGISDWIELKNVSSQTVQLKDYYISDEADDRLLWQLPDKSLEPGEYFLVMCNTEESLLGAAPLCMAFSLNSTADRVYLSRADGSLADYVSLRDIPYDGSYGRMPGQNGWFFLSEPSPGRENAGGQRRVSALPWSLEPDGVFNGVDSVTVSLAGLGEIHYTTDGSLPSLNSPVYQGPFTMNKTGVVKAISVEPGALPSRVLSLSYLLNENHVLPVMSLVSHDNSMKNVYYSRRESVEVPCTLSFYDNMGPGFSIPCGVRLHGQTSLDLPKKNLNVRFRGLYGQEELHYNVFADGGVSDFTNLLLRGGQDYFHAIVRNELCTELARTVTDRVLISRNRYCILYIDGTYMGIYALGEKLNEAMYAHQLGVDRDSVTAETPPLDGKHAMYREVFVYAMTHDLSQPENYAELCTRLDVDSLIDWLILEGCFANDDLTFGNVRYCRSLEGDGRWRLMFYDLDSTLYNPDTVFSNLLSPWARSSRQVAQLINMLLTSPEFRARLLQRAGEIIPRLSNEKILSELDRLCAEIDPEVERDYARNGMNKEGWEWNVNWIREFIVENDWNRVCIQNFCYYLNVTAEERARYFPG